MKRLCRRARRLIPPVFAWPILAWPILVCIALPGRAADLTLAEFPRDRVIVDVGAALGRTAAQVEIRGTAPAGTQVELRLVHEDGRPAGDWIPAGPADAGGAWQGRLTLAADPHWYRVEARPSAAPDAVLRTRTRIGGGDVVAFLGQSELSMLFSLNQSKTPAPRVADADAQVQVTVGAAPGDHAIVGNDAAVSATIRSMARFWQDNAPPGRKLHLVNLARAGTRHTHLADDRQAQRSWADLEAIVAAVRASGSDIGLVMESWFAGDRSVGKNWETAFTPFYTGLSAGGRVFPTGGMQPINRRQAYQIDHFLWDLSGRGRGLFDPAHTVLGIFGPHRFDNTAPRVSALVRTNGKIAHGLRVIEASRRGVTAFLANPFVSRIAHDGLLPPPLDYANGFFKPDGAWADVSHPAAASPDGLPRFGLHAMAATLIALGHAGFDAPVFDRVTWTPHHVTLGSSEGPLTTARAARGLPPLGRDLPHWTEVMGFEINGAPVTRTALQPDGTLRIFPPEGRVFTAADVLSYGNGGANGALRPPRDRAAGTYLNMPLVDVGLTGLEGVSVRPDPDGLWLRNTLR